MKPIILSEREKKDYCKSIAVDNGVKVTSRMTKVQIVDANNATVTEHVNNAVRAAGVTGDMVAAVKSAIYANPTRPVVETIAIVQNNVARNTNPAFNIAAHIANPTPAPVVETTTPAIIPAVLNPVHIPAPVEVIATVTPADDDTPAAPVEMVTPAPAHKDAAPVVDVNPAPVFFTPAPKGTPCNELEVLVKSCRATHVAFENATLHNADPDDIADLKDAAHAAALDIYKYVWGQTRYMFALDYLDMDTTDPNSGYIRGTIDVVFGREVIDHMALSHTHTKIYPAFMLAKRDGLDPHTNCDVMVQKYPEWYLDPTPADVKNGRVYTTLKNGRKIEKKLGKDGYPAARVVRFQKFMGDVRMVAYTSAAALVNKDDLKVARNMPRFEIVYTPDHMEGK